MTVYVHSTDGKTVDSGISMEPREGWTPCIYEPPKTEADEVCVCDGFVREGEAFRAVFKTTKVEVEPMKYSVVSIIEAMRGIGKYEQFRALVESARLDWDFIGANYMAENHPSFVRMCAALVDSGIVTKAQLNEMLPKCVWSAN